MSEEFVPGDGASESQPDTSTQTKTEATPAQQSSPSLTLADVQRLLDAQKMALLGEFEKRTTDAVSRAQSKSDKAMAEALKRAKVIDDISESLGLDEAKKAEVKRQVIDREFERQFAATDPPAQLLPVPVPPTTQTALYVTRSEILSLLAEAGLDETAIDIGKYENKRRDDAELAAEWDTEVTIARAKKLEAARKRKQQGAQAQQAAGVKQEFGTLSTPAPGTPSAGYDPVKELEKMNEQEPPSDPRQRAEWWERYTKYAQEAERKGWG